jgi:ABC-type maltose transport system permease subunit
MDQYNPKVNLVIEATHNTLVAVLTFVLSFYSFSNWKFQTTFNLLLISLVFAAASAFLGHIGAITVPKLFGFEDTSTAGMMALTAGVLFGGVFLFAPRYGYISRLIHQFLLGIKIVRDDILGFLYRYQELFSWMLNQLKNPR